ncbi:metal cation transporter, zinc(II)-iron(II) permease (ZIP) family protein [Achromobacter piechaudii ATCC 43553]|uniref:Metal cation transporter, zinc(II)-iron(II) permease (ZIP) family protein n=1 Tax=Achromobacter piechaudii ATCC 43553 TaxID=742159 RepID=D4XJE1_9BURK|nr:metal cation transporter, zinc(II)-iron(II) permease (ZIP) family protein [Achromobacter piechaudii ATCC 43553]
MNTFSRHRVRPAATSISVWTLAVLVSCLAMHQLWAYLDVRAPHVADALLGGLVAAAATALGTVPILFARTIPQKVQDSMFGFGAGVMLAASAFSLVAPGIEAAKSQGMGPWGAGLTVGAASCWARRCC